MFGDLLEAIRDIGLKTVVFAVVAGTAIGASLSFPVLALMSLAPDYPSAIEGTYIEPPDWDDDTKRCYRATLSEDAQRAYDEIETSIRGLHDGVRFSHLTTFWETQEALRCVLRDNPDIFWVDQYDSQINFSPVPLMSYGITYAKMDMTPFEIEKQHARCIKVAKEVVEESAYKTSLELPDSPQWRVNCYIAGYLHDYVKNALSYKEGKLDQTALPVFSKEMGEAVCGGYSMGYKFLMDAAGIPCLYVAGQSAHTGGYHAWNMFSDGNGIWYVDVTWDDHTDTSFRSYRWFTEAKRLFTASHLAENEELVEDFVRAAGV